MVMLHAFWQDQTNKQTKQASVGNQEKAILSIAILNNSEAQLCEINCNFSQSTVLPNLLVSGLLCSLCSLKPSYVFLFSMTRWPKLQWNGMYDTKFPISEQSEVIQLQNTVHLQNSCQSSISDILHFVEMYATVRNPQRGCPESPLIRKDHPLRKGWEAAKDAEIPTLLFNKNEQDRSTRQKRERAQR